MKTLYFRALVLVVIVVTVVSFRNSFRELSILLDRSGNLAQVVCSANSLTATPNPAGPSDQVTVSWSITSNCALPRLFVGSQDSIGLPSVSGTYNIGTITADTLIRLRSSGVLLSSTTVIFSSGGTTTPTPPKATPLPALIYPVPAGDVTAPSAVSNLRTWGVCDNMIGPTWDHATDNVNVAGYIVERNGVLLTETIRTRPLNNTTTIRTWTTDTGLSPNTPNSYSVYAFDTSGNKGPKTTINPTTTSGGCFYQMAPVPANLKVTSTTSSSVTLDWDPVTDPAYNVATYRVYDVKDINNPTNSPVYSSNTSSYTDSGLQPNSTHSYFVSARNTNLKEGDWTTHITVTTPASTGPVVTLTASPSTINSGSSSTLRWSSTNATSCSAPWTSSTATYGTQPVSPAVTTTYTLTCTNGSGGSANKTVTVTVSSGGGSVGLPTPPAIFQVPMPNQTGKIISVPAGDANAFKQALTNAQLGDTIELQAGSTYNGNFTLPNKTTGSGWIVIRSSNYNLLQASGIRVSPADAHNMAKIVKTGSSSGTPTIGTDDGAHHFRLIGLEITIPQISVQTSIVDIAPRVNSGNINSQPQYIVLDRSYIHGNPITNLSRCVVTNGMYIAVMDSYVSECHAKGIDSQAIAVSNGAGPFKYVNNRLEGAGENIIFGGSDPAVQGLIPSDIEIRGNYIYTPPSWGAGMVIKPWTKKNIFELKNAQRVLLEGNILDGSWGDAQVGYAVLMKSVNQNGNCTWCSSGHITIRYNIIRNAGAGFNLTGREGANPHKQGPLLNHVLIEHNILENINVPPYTGDASIVQLLQNADNIIFRNNTMSSKVGALETAIAVGNLPAATDVEFSDNIMDFGTYGIFGSKSNEAQLALRMAGIVNYSGQVFIGSTRTGYPTSTFKPDLASAEATGKGANRSAVLAATQYALNGGGTPPPPPTTPSLTLTANPTSVIVGSASALSWSGSNISTCTASGGWSGTKATSGTQSVSPTATTTYTLACSGSNGSVSKSVTVGITPPPPAGAPALTLALNPTSIQSGFSSLLSWLGTNVTTCTASGGWLGTRPTSGSLTVSPAVSTTYALLCSGSGGATISRSATLTVTAPPSTPKPTVTFTAFPTTIVLGQSSALSWVSTDAASCSASGSWSGSKTTSGTQSVSPQGNATYTIQCTGNGGSTSESVTVTVSSASILPTLSLGANPSSVERGSSAVLTWVSTNATSCTASGDWSGSKTTSGSTTVSPISSATYTLICSNSTGNAVANTSITVTVPPPPNFGNGGGVCAQGITWAKSPLTGETRQFSNSCDVPTGWIILNSTFNPPVIIQPINRSLYFGLKDPQVVQLQDFLKSKGFFPATQASTGFFGPLTMKAVQDYQRSKGIEPLGNVGPQTRAAIAAELGGVVGTPTTPTAPATGAFTRSLYRGLTGADVTYLQLLLKKLGFFPLAEPTTTYFGPFTENAVKAFQVANGIVSSGDPASTGYGLAGVRTRAKILELAQ